MRTFYTIVLTFFLVSITVSLSIILIKTKTFDYCKTYFEIKKSKLELAKPEKVDSLLNVIKFQDSIVQNYYTDIDSINNYWIAIKKLDDNEIHTLQDKLNTVLSTLNSQNKIIEDLRKNN